MKRGKDACHTPGSTPPFRGNDRREIRSSILTDGSITELVKVVDEQMDGIAGEQRKRLKTIEDELEDVKRRLGAIWNAIETSAIDISDASDRIKEHRERKERLEDAAADARAILSERRAHLDNVDTIAAYARDMKDFLEESELTERRSFIESFVKEIMVIPGDALIRYTVPMPNDRFFRLVGSLSKWPLTTRFCLPYTSAHLTGQNQELLPSPSIWWCRSVSISLRPVVRQRAATATKDGIVPPLPLRQGPLFLLYFRCQRLSWKILARLEDWKWTEQRFHLMRRLYTLGML